MGFCTNCGTEVTAGGQYCAKCGAVVSGPGGGAPRTASARPSAETLATQEQKLLALVRQVTLGEYEILAEIGKGGMAVVYLGHDLALDRKVAIKVMSPALTMMDRGIQERFKREARTAASLSHPNIIPVYAVKESKDLVYFVMKYIAGRSLDSVIRDVGPMPIPVVQTVLGQVGSAVGYAHRRGVVHRDLKPGNVMLDEEGWVVVADFGIAKVAQAEALTVTGGMVGTPAYMSPEQCGGGEVTGASDQYSLGIVAYEMLTGRQPFQSVTMVNLIYDHCHTPPPPLSELRPDCPPAIAAAVMRMLEKDPARRWPSVEEAVEAIGIAPEAEGTAARNSLSTMAQPGSAAHLLEKFRTPGSPIPRSGRRAATPSARSPVPASSVPPTRLGVQPAPAPTRPARRALAWALPLGAVVLGVAGWLVFRGRAPSEAIPPAPVAVVPAPTVARLDLTPLSVALEPGQRATLRATARDAEGREMAEAPLTWASSDSRVATVSAGGEVRAVGPGTAQLTARTGASSAAAVVTVARRAPTTTVAAEAPAPPSRPAAPVTPPRAAVESTNASPPAPAPAPAADTARPISSAVVPAEPAPSVARPVDHRPAIERVLENYRRAIESRDLAQLRAAYPGLTAEQERAWRDFFGSITHITATLTVRSLETAGDQAQARIAVTYEYRARANQTQNLDLTAALALRPSGWQITAIR
jgi:serine/threonine-protein kinase